jgi:hypothetical protein
VREEVPHALKNVEIRFHPRLEEFAVEQHGLAQGTCPAYPKAEKRVGKPSGYRRRVLLPVARLVCAELPCVRKVAVP